MNKKIGAFINQLRKENNLTQEQLAEKLGVTNRSISRWENGTTLPDISLMKCICEEFNISISELINGKRENTSLAETNINDKANLKAKEVTNIILEFSKYETKQKTKAVTLYFSFGLLFLLIILLQGILITFEIIETPFLSKTQTLIFFFIAFLSEFAGFYYNNKTKEFSNEEINILLQDENNIQMKSVSEMLQFARKNQTNIFRQHELAFKEIFSFFENDEYAIFTMLADEYSINNSPGPWHIAVAITNKRLFVCGETISGRMFTRYDTDSWPLEELKSIRLENKLLIINTSKETLTLKGDNLDELFIKLKNTLKL